MCCSLICNTLILILDIFLSIKIWNTEKWANPETNSDGKTDFDPRLFLIFFLQFCTIVMMFVTCAACNSCDRGCKDSSAGKYKYVSLNLKLRSFAREILKQFSIFLDATNQFQIKRLFQILWPSKNISTFLTFPACF